MNLAHRVKATAIGLLLFCALFALAEGSLVMPSSYAQIEAQSNNHTKTHGPPSFQSGTTSTLNTGSISGAGNGHGRRGDVPPGLLRAWAHSNMSVVARAVTHAIFLNGTHGVELAEIAIAASSNGQMMRNIANNETVAQVDFDHDGAVELVVNSSEKPAAVFADDIELNEAQWNIGLTPNSNAWVYDENSHMLTIYADPSSITLVYASAPTPVSEFPVTLAAFVLLLGLFGTILAARKASKKPSRLSVRATHRL